MFNFLMSHVLRVFESNENEQKHHFGGKPIHKIKNWSLKNLNLHCLYLFDLNDPAMPKLLNGCRWLPLYYPLFENCPKILVNNYKFNSLSYLLVPY